MQKMPNITRSRGMLCIENVKEAEDSMSFIQRFFTRVLPSAWVRSMEEDSRQWMVSCNCGHQRSVWDLGGIRWKAYGNPRWFMNCPACGKSSWHRVSKDSDRR